MHTPPELKVTPQERSPSESEMTSVGANIPSNDASDSPTVSAHEAGLDLLSANVLNAAMYGPEEGYPPLQPLQPAALQHIREWMDDPAPPSPVMWLGGSSVVVRSAAAQKIVEIYQASDRFAASFFFRGGRDEDDQTRALVTTISYQVATNVDALRAPIDAVITADPSVLDKSLDAQFQALVVGPFVEADSLRLPQFLVVIDGLGEVVRQESQVYILELIASAVGTSKIPLRFLISSPEPHVKSTLGLNPYIGSSQTILLDDYNSSKVAVSALDAASFPSQLINSHSDNSSRPILRRLLPSSKRPVRHTKHNSLDSFPKLVTVRSANGHAESYSRSLMMTGNGFPLWYPGGDIGKPMEHLRRGVSIGDVGILDSDGLFDFCFNIFLPPDNPVHAGLVPVGFRPIEPALEPSEIEMIPEHFKPGHVITSQGITVTTKSSNPLDIYFSSVDREGGVVILPNGGSRENLIKTDRIHEYAKRNAPYWYQDVNGYGGVVHTNGSLLLVTGCDKTDDWALASFPYYTGGKAPLNLRYTQQPDHGDPWIDNNSARTSFYEPSQARPITSGAGTRHQCVFVRGMRISLSDKSWRETMPPSESARLFYTFILRSPSALELLVDNLLVYLRLRMSERRAMSKVTPGRLQLFHPNFVIGQELLKLAPNSDVALLDDSVWCSLTHKSICTASEVNSLVTAVFDRNDVVERNGIVTLESKGESGYGTIPKPPHVVSEPQPLWSKLFLFRKRHRHWVQDVPVSEHAKLF